ncbi:putative integrase protein [Agrobacterium fabacearum CFBP 5771]|nr:putative integrase protein [Agrobacterium fabacearum CFBP 5771]
MPRLYLTDALVREARCPAGKDQEIYWDCPVASDGSIKHGSVAGLGLRVTVLGNKTFVHGYIFNRRRIRKAIGSTVVLTVAAARMAVSDRERKVDTGENPDLDENDASRIHLMTVREAVDRYWESHITTLVPKSQDAFVRFVGTWLRRTPKTATRRGRNKTTAYTDFGKMFGDRPFSSIKPLDIERFQRQFTSLHSYNRGLTHVSALFNWAIRMQLVDMRNPCDPISKKKIIRHRRDYSMEQIRQITAHIFYPVFEAIPEIEDLSGLAKRNAALTKAQALTANEQMAELCNYMGILFLTMARPSDLTNAEFAHFDLEKLVWNKHNTKGIKLSRSLHEYAYRTIPIHTKVAEMVRAQRISWPDSKLAFPSHQDKSRPRDNFRKGLAKFKTLPGVPDYFQLYDLKRIAISLMLTGQGVSREAVSHYVDHKGNLETTMIYDLGLVDPMRPVTQRLGELAGI